MWCDDGANLMILFLIMNDRILCAAAVATACAVVIVNDGWADGLMDGTWRLLGCMYGDDAWFRSCGRLDDGLCFFL